MVGRKEGNYGGQKNEGNIVGGKKRLDIALTKENDTTAETISRTLRKNGVLSVNIMGAPGSGKTTIIENVARIIGTGKVAVIQGDLESDIDKKRLEGVGIETWQINTHSGCHLDAGMVMEGLLGLHMKDKEFLFIENVGNLVCPAGVRIGQHLDLVVSSTSEGSDKPRKYPIIFLDAKIIVITKGDLAKYTDFDEKRYIVDVKGISPKAVIIQTQKGDMNGFEEIAHELMHKREHLLGHGHAHLH